jgi:hypothetical protein
MGEAFGHGFRAGQVPRAASPQATYRAAQVGDESYMPSFHESGPSLRDVVTGIPGGLVDTARMATTPPPQLPPNVFIHGDGLYVGRYPDGRLVRWEDADPDAANAYYEEMQKRAELPARIALSMLGGGAGFAERGALGAAGGGLRRPPFKGQPPPRLPNPPVEPGAPRSVEPVRPPAEGIAELNVGPSHVEQFRARIGVPAIHTVAVGRTNVPGLEGILFEGASPEVWKKARLSPAPPGKYESPSALPRDRGHAETEIFNKFKRAVEERGLQPSQLEGSLVIHVSNPSGVCPPCRWGLNNPNAPAGVIKQFSMDFPKLNIEFSVATEPGTKVIGPSRFSVRNGSYVSRSDR